MPSSVRRLLRSAEPKPRFMQSGKLARHYSGSPLKWSAHVGIATQQDVTTQQLRSALRNGKNLASFAAIAGSGEYDGNQPVEFATSLNVNRRRKPAGSRLRDFWFESDPIWKWHRRRRQASRAQARTV